MYVEGQDWVRAGAGFGRTANSRIPDFNDYTYATSFGNRFAFSSEPRNPPLTINYNVYIDYTTQKKEQEVTALVLGRQQSSVLCLGDSIADGAHTIESYYRGNDSQSWCGLLRSALAPGMSVRNESVPGGSLRSIASDLQAYSALPGDTVILAFGMNDHVFEPENGVAGFESELETVVSAFLARKSNVILVGFFQQNELWELEERAKTVSYNQAIRSVAQSKKVPFIDILAAFEAIRVGMDPQFAHVTGDFMHHPNVYGQRIYYSLLIPYFIQSSRSSSTIPHYVQGPWTN